MLLSRGRTVFIADTTVHACPSAGAARRHRHAGGGQGARQMLGLEPRVALLSYSNFGNPMGEAAQRVRDAVALLDAARRRFRI